MFMFFNTKSVCFAFLSHLKPLENVTAVVLQLRLSSNLPQNVNFQSLISNFFAQKSLNIIIIIIIIVHSLAVVSVCDGIGGRTRTDNHSQTPEK